MATRQLCLRWTFAALLASAVIAAIALRDRLDLHAVEAVINSLGSWGPAAFIAFFAIGTVLLLPGSVLGLAGGLLFGPVWGTALILPAARWGRSWPSLSRAIWPGIGSRGEPAGGFSKSSRASRLRGGALSYSLRLVPLIPFNLANYALGLTRISLIEYALATAVAMVPGTASFAGLGHAGRGALAGDAGALRYGLLGLAALAAIAFLPRLVRRVTHKPVEEVGME